MKWIGTYAGYSQKLLELFSAELKNNYDLKEIKLLEPMCGSGKLLVLLEQNHIPYTAYDVNPVQVIQCNAKIANIAKSNYRKIIGDFKRTRLNEIKSTVVCREWFSPEVAESLMDLYSKILNYSINKTPDIKHFLMGAFILTLRRNACFAASSNPTWLKKGGMIPGTNIKETFIAASDFIGSWHEDTYVEKRSLNYGHVSVKNYKMMEEQSCYDLCIVSPPYCNRLDYKRMFAPEYYFITTFIESQNDYYFMGNNEVTNFDFSTYKPTSYESKLLKEIKKKQAPENRDYYFKYYFKYFSELESLLNKLLTSLKSDGELFINVQNSHYKDIEINLDEIIQFKIQEKHIISQLYSKQNSFFGNLLKAKKRQKETVLRIVKT